MITAGQQCLRERVTGTAHTALEAISTQWRAVSEPLLRMREDVIRDELVRTDPITARISAEAVDPADRGDQRRGGRHVDAGACLLR